VCTRVVHRAKQYVGHQENSCHHKINEKTTTEYTYNQRYKKKNTRTTIPHDKAINMYDLTILNGTAECLSSMINTSPTEMRGEMQRIMVMSS